MNEQVLKIVQQMDKELQTEPLHAHASIVQMLQTLLQHRATVESHKEQEKQQKDQFAAELAMNGAQRPRLI